MASSRFFRHSPGRNPCLAAKKEGERRGEEKKKRKKRSNRRFRPQPAWLFADDLERKEEEERERERGSARGFRRVSQALAHEFSSTARRNKEKKKGDNACPTIARSSRFGPALRRRRREGGRKRKGGKRRKKERYFNRLSSLLFPGR